MTNLRGPRPPWECCDSRGAPITAGCEVFWRPPKHSRFIRAFVRACDDSGALIDDGDRGDANLVTNGFTVSAIERDPRRVTVRRPGVAQVQP